MKKWFRNKYTIIYGLMKLILVIETLFGMWVLNFIAALGFYFTGTLITIAYGLATGIINEKGDLNGQS